MSLAVVGVGLCFPALFVAFDHPLGGAAIFLIGLASLAVASYDLHA